MTDETDDTLPPRDPLLQQFLEDHADPDEELLTLDGFDHCIVGLVSGFNATPVVAYDEQAVLDTLIQRDDMTPEDAYEFYSFNIAGAYVGGGTPVFIKLFQREQIAQDSAEN